MFNVRVKKFNETEQIQVFSETLLSAGSEREDRRGVVYSTGEICPTNKSMFYNPFDDCVVVGNFLHDKDDACIQRSVRRTKTVVYDLAKCNNWEWFCTFTFNKEKVDRYSFDKCSGKMSNWLSNMRKICPSMKYIVVPEMHEDGAWHFHGLFSCIDDLKMSDSGKKDHKGRSIYNVGRYKFGFTEATKVTDTNSASGYITKYYTKQMLGVTYNKRRYWVSKNLKRPVVNDFLIEGADSFARHMIKDCIYYKRTKGYIDTTYIEVKKGSSDFLLETEELKDIWHESIYTTNMP